MSWRELVKMMLMPVVEFEEGGMNVSREEKRRTGREFRWGELSGLCVCISHISDLSRDPKPYLDLIRDPQPYPKSST